MTHTPTDQTTPPTVTEIEQALKETVGVTIGLLPPAFYVLARLRDLLTSGDYALVSRADREQALAAAYSSACVDHVHLGDEARALLQLKGSS